MIGESRLSFWAVGSFCNKVVTMKKLVIFDLDGTLLNTIADLANSTNYALAENGFATHQVSEYNYFVGNGINKLFERALPEKERNEENILKIRKAFLSHYDRHNMDHSSPYPGIADLLAALQEKGVMIAVASNKYQAATEKLVPYFFPNIHFVAILGQRDGVNTKPDPTIVHDILRIAQVSKEDALYVGDSNVDMQTAINSGVDACGVVWGFRPVEELESYHPKYIAHTAADILEYLG